MIREVRRAAVGPWLLLWVLLAACATDVEPLPPPTLTPFPPDLYIGLSDAAAPLSGLVAPSYEQTSGEAEPVFLPGNDAAILSDLQQGLLEAAIVYHLPADSQFWFSPIAVDGVVIITHPDVAVDDLTSDRLRGILSGSINNWSEVGGPDLAISVLGREPGSGAREILLHRIMDNARFSPTTEVAASDDYMQQLALTNPGAAGYSLNAGVTGDTVRLDGVAATSHTLADQSYPLTAPLYFVTTTEPTGALRDFLAWLQSENGQDVLGEKYGRVR